VASAGADQDADRPDRRPHVRCDATPLTTASLHIALDESRPTMACGPLHLVTDRLADIMPTGRRFAGVDPAQPKPSIPSEATSTECQDIWNSSGGNAIVPRNLQFPSVKGATCFCHGLLTEANMRSSVSWRHWPRPPRSGGMNTPIPG